MLNMKNVIALLQLLCLFQGNCGSAFIQIDVGRSSWPPDHPYTTLLPTTTLMSPAESRQGTVRTGVRMFKKGAN